MVTSMCQQLSPRAAEVHRRQRTIPGLDWAPALASLPAPELNGVHGIGSGVAVCVCVCVSVCSVVSHSL